MGLSSSKSPLQVFVCVFPVFRTAYISIQNCSGKVPAACWTGPRPTTYSALIYKTVFASNPPSFKKSDPAGVRALRSWYTPQTAPTNCAVHHQTLLLTPHSIKSFEPDSQPPPDAFSFPNARLPAVFSSYFWCHQRFGRRPHLTSYRGCTWSRLAGWLGSRTLASCTERLRWNADPTAAWCCGYRPSYRWMCSRTLPGSYPYNYNCPYIYLYQRFIDLC